MPKYFVPFNIDPPKRVEIVKYDGRIGEGPSPWWSVGQFGYAVAYSTDPGLYTESGSSRAGDLSYLVYKSKPNPKRTLSGSPRSTQWFSSEGIRFTTKAPRSLIDALTDDERVALDCLIQHGGECHTLKDLVPKAERADHVRMVADQVRSLTRSR